MKTVRELIARARSGDKEAFGALFDRNLPSAIRTARGIVGNPDIAHDLVQEAMVQAYVSLNHLKDENRFQSWLHGIVRNVCHSYLRSRGTVPISWEAMTEDQVAAGELALPGPQALVEDQEWRHAVRTAVGTLSPEDQAAILLFYYEQNNMAEIAVVLQISIVAVRVRLHRARKQLEGPLLHLHAGYHSGQNRRITLITMTGDYNQGEDTKPTPSKKGKYQEERLIAEAALAKYGIGNARISLHGRARNTWSDLPMRVDVPETGQKYVLRFHRPGDFGIAETLASEMMWLNALHQDVASFIPEPVPNLTGAFVTDPGIQTADGTPESKYNGWLCSLTRWVDGRLVAWPIGTRRAHSLGALMARMHLHSETWTSPEGFTRPSYDVRRMSHFMPSMEAGVKSGRITEDAVGVYRAFFAYLSHKLEGTSREPSVWGMIHGDIHDENRVCFRNEMRPIDFAQCGFGYYTYDIAGAVMSMCEDERKTFYDGYMSIRPLPPDYEDQVLDFHWAHWISCAYYHGFISGEEPDPSEGYDKLAWRIERIALTPWADVDTSVYDEYVGLYLRVPAASGVIIEILRDGDRLLYQRKGWPAYQLYPIEADHFIERNSAWRQKFERDESGRIVSFTEDQHVQNVVFLKQNLPAEPDATK